MTIRSYDLSIISDQEAADRIGRMAGMREDLQDFGLAPERADKIRNGVFSPDAAWLYSQQVVSETLDILALRKAQAFLHAKAQAERDRESLGSYMLGRD